MITASGSVEQKVTALAEFRLEHASRAASLAKAPRRAPNLGPDARRARYLGRPLVDSRGFFGAHTVKGARVSIRWASIADAASAGFARGLVSERELLTSLRDADALVPHVLAAEVDSAVACLVLREDEVAGSFSVLVERHPASRMPIVPLPLRCQKLAGSAPPGAR